MALTREFLKTSAVAVVALLQVLGWSPLPQASAVALIAIQTFSLLGHLSNSINAPPSKQAKMLSTEKALPTAAADAFTHGLRSCAKALVARAAVRNVVWVGLAILIKQAMRAAGFGASPLLVVTFACALGASMQYAASALAKSQVTCCAAGCQCGAEGGCKTLRCPYEPTFWPSVQVAADVSSESPVAAMALDTTFELQLPPIVLETEGFLFDSDNAQPSKMAKMLSTKKTLPTAVADAINHGLRSFAEALLARAALRSAMWVGLAIIVKQLLLAIGLCASPCLVLTFSCALGAAIQYTASALAKPQMTCSAAGGQDDAAGACKIVHCPDDPAFWPSLACGGEASEDAVSESPLAAMAMDTTFKLQLPPIELETEDFLFDGDNAQPSKQARTVCTKKAFSTVAAKALLARPALRNAVWVGLAILSKQLLRAIGFGGSPCLVLTFACGLGAAFQYTATALAKSEVICCAAGCQCGAEGTCKTLRCPYGPTFWPSMSCYGKASDDVVSESPLVAMALDTSFSLQLPAVALETED